MDTASDIVPDSERRGLIGALPAAVRPYASPDPARPADRRVAAVLAGRVERGAGGHGQRPGSLLAMSGWALVAWLALGAWAMRSAGCVYNDIVDRDLDRQVERTRLRPLASGRVSLKGAWALLVAMSLIGLVVLLQLQRTAQIVALVSLAPVALYPVHEADHLVAAGVARPGLLLGGSGRLAGGDRADGRRRLLALGRLDLLGDRLRHDLRAAGQGGRRPGRGEILGARARQACPDRASSSAISLALALWTLAIREVRLEWWAPARPFARWRSTWSARPRP